MVSVGLLFSIGCYFNLFWSMSVVAFESMGFQHDSLSGYIILKYLRNTSEVSTVGTVNQIQDGSTYTELITANP